MEFVLNLNLFIVLPGGDEAPVELVQEVDWLQLAENLRHHRPGLYLYMYL